MDNSVCPAALLGALSISRKAGALALGYDAVLQSLKSRAAVLLLFATDVSAGTRRRLTEAAPKGLRVETLPCTKEELAALGRKPVGVLSVTDANLAGLCLSKMDGAAAPEK